MLVKLNSILIFALIAFLMWLFFYPIYIKILQKLKVWKTIREEAITWEKSIIFSKLHKHKAWTPTMWWGLLLLITLIMILSSLLVQKLGWSNNSLINRQETYVLLAGFFGMWLIGLIDDILNIRWCSKKKWLSARAKLIMMFIFSAFISRWFYAKLWVDYINLRPFAWKVSIWIFYPILTFLITISIVNAINIVDWLDWLAGGLMAVIFFVLWAVTLINQTYIATTLVIIVTAVLASFMFFNIFPAKIFMWDSGAFAMWWLVASLLYLLNMRMGIFIPFIVLFLLFIIEVTSSLLQIFWKKVFHKKLFEVAPLHHLFEKRWLHESTIVMRFRMIQALLAAVFIIMMFYQIWWELI
jgi:phospho-N-acetylmuramoyl-pentapeptide-transferase